MADQDQRISQVVDRERSRLLNFIRRRVSDPSDAEDILQDVFYKLVEANRLLMPIEHVTGWLFRVARNRITDLFRKKKPEAFPAAAIVCASADFLRSPECSKATVSIPPPKRVCFSSILSSAAFNSPITASASSATTINSTLIFV